MEGCIWAAPYEVRFYDFSEPERCEQILQIVNKGVSTFEWVPETLLPGSRSGPISREIQSSAALFFLNLSLDAFLAEKDAEQT